ncbi:PLP-dependent transferase [Sphingosinicella sp. LY1275]|uniref:PLP-dependent transferase n=1 Tax=Sphingosinicella sp. LY1275 TaxID=3095379 RepID=UPI002ADEB697|nr:PLP-dependent transferase [Sphingosinicella sp. LY1275]MEA1015502.1 PLP-dependent transferase [Sphingosinicella sp. LY1275]
MTVRRPATIVNAVRATAAQGGVVPPLYQSDTYRWPDSDTKPDYDYSRTVNPNRDVLAGTLAELEGAVGGAVTNSGQSAALLALLLLPGDALVVAPHDCYGGTYRLIKGLEDQGRLRSLFVDLADRRARAEAMAAKPALVWIETPSNPLLRVTDIAAIAAEAHAVGALAIADNTLATPVRQRPLALGCDLVMHSTTKALNGHCDLFGGALLAKDPALVERILWWSNAAGLNGSAQDSAQILRGLRTLTLRVDRQEQSAERIASWLDGHPQVEAVHYPGLAAHPDHGLAARQQSGPGFMISFRVKGGDAATAAFLAALELVTLASSLGGFASLICKPATMTHRGMPPVAQAKAGIHGNLLRLSIGLEDADDLLADLARGFAATA